MLALILASTSPTRRRILDNAGLAFGTASPGVDEEEIKLSLKASGASGAQIAETLAELKATRISGKMPEALVIGADQILALGGEWFDKPVGLEEARTQLLKLRGGSHLLATAACVVKTGQTLWSGTSVPELTMRPFSDSFLDDYIAAEGESLLGSVGAYRLEGRGVQLFSRINGDHFTILGLPLIELLEFLRQRGALPR